MYLQQFIPPEQPNFTIAKHLIPGINKVLKVS